MVAILQKIKEMKLNISDFIGSRGLGDTVEKITEVTGIKRVVEKVSKVTGKDCGCKKRKEKLNKMFPYKK